MARKEPFIALGKIVRPHGIRGEIQVHSYTARPDSFTRYETLLIPESGGNYTVYKVRSVRFKKGSSVLLSLEGVDDRNRAVELVGMEVFVEKDQLPPLDEDEFYWHDIEGLRALSLEGEELGVVRAVVDSGAHDIYVVDGPAGEILVPAVEDVVRTIDPDKGIMIVNLPPGLVEANAL